MPKGLADKVASHIVAAGTLIDEDPQHALVHARFARRCASRVWAVREANGLTAYAAGEWNEALAELRAARRMAGGAGHLALMIDCERALGRPERALELSRDPEAAELVGEEAVELRMVVSGVRRDLGEIEAAVVGLQIPELDPQRQDPWSARLFYAYADSLLAADRVQEAFTWFVHAAHADDEGDTDAPERLDELVEVLGGPAVADDLVAQAASVEQDSTAASGVDGLSLSEPGDGAPTSGEGTVVSGSETAPATGVESDSAEAPDVEEQDASEDADGNLSAPDGDTGFGEASDPSGADRPAGGSGTS